MNDFDLKKYLAEGKLLKEAKDNPKAIILAGAPGAGKGYILKGLDLGGIKVMNVDDIYIGLLKKANVSLDLKNATPEERSEQAKQMAVANKEFKGNIAATIEGKESFILDGTAASYNSTVKLKDELEEAGYDVFMLYVYTDLERSLAQNQSRFEKSGGEDRSLAPAIVMRTWKSVTQNLDKYADLFGNNFVAVANTLDDIESISDLESIIKKYLTPFSPKNTKPKSPAQQKRSDDNKAKDAEELKAMLNSDFVYDVIKTSVSKEAAQMRIKQFLNG
ncbi:zeta toxin family protein [bacterium]|nr:zeta toxin family protein [bacterium]